jgi:hypothetical protein
MVSFNDILNVISKSSVGVKAMLIAMAIVIIFFYYILFFITIPGGSIIEISKLVIIDLSLTGIVVFALIEEAQKKTNLIKK